MKFPRSRPSVRALLIALFLVMGFWGYVHFISAVITAIHWHRLNDINPYHLVNIDRLLGRLAHNGFTFALGWLVFFAMVGGAYWYLVRNARK